jgi:aldehyde dehydrogenase (NAD+)
VTVEALKAACERLGTSLPEGVAAVVGGQVIRVRPTLEVHDPATGAIFFATGEAGANVVDQAVRDAHATFRGVWREHDGPARAKVLRAISEGLLSVQEDLAIIEAVDTGKPISQARGDIATAARYFEFYAGVADKIYGETIPSARDLFIYTEREPLGVIAHITPWNSPVNQWARGVAPSLAAGNTVVLKPSEIAPISSIVIARLLSDWGLPEGAANVVFGRGSVTGEALTAHDLVPHIAFTGSVRGGSAVMTAAARRIASVGLELGGKSPSIVCPDADLDAALAAAIGAMKRNAGQTCFATTRMIVHRGLHDVFVERLAKQAAALRQGPALEDPDLGPLASAAQLKRVRSLVSTGLSEGAKMVGPITTLHPQKEPPAGYFFPPTILVGVRPRMTVEQEEVFGPVQCVISYDDEAEAIAIANDSDYGLSAGVFTRDASAARRIASALEAGQVHINRYPAGGIETPFGGYKRSGIGREKGLEALRHYTQLKTVITAVDHTN